MGPLRIFLDHKLERQLQPPAAETMTRVRVVVALIPVIVVPVIVVLVT